MQGFKDLLPKSPFTAMIEHIDKVALCLDELENLFLIIRKKEFSKLEVSVDKIVKLEMEADAIKDDVRATIKKNLFIPFDKGEILSILTAQDGIADVAEDIARLFTLRNMEIPTGLENDYDIFVTSVIQAARKGVETIRELSNLFEAGFKGPEVEKVVKIMHELEKNENDADEEGLSFTRKIIALENKESPVAIYMWMRIIKVMGDLANISEKLGNRFRLLLN